MTTVAVPAASLHTGDALDLHDWAGTHALHIAQAEAGDWCDHAGVVHHGVIAVTRELGPIYPLHFERRDWVRVHGTVVRWLAALLHIGGAL